MSYPVITDTFGVVDSGDFSLSWDTTTPDPDGPPSPGDRKIVDGMAASWSIDVLPPVAQPSTCQFSVFQAGPDPLGSWLPWVIGTPIRVDAYAYPQGLGSPTNLFSFDGRISDLSGVNVDGGILFTVICSDRLADLASQGSPGTVAPDATQSDLAPGLFDIYDQLADDAGIDFDYQAGQSYTLPYWWDIVDGPIDLTNVSTLDALSTAIMHDVRPNDDPNVAPVVHNVDRWLTQDVDTGITTPTDPAEYRLNEWDPQDVNDLAGVAQLVWTGSEWVIQVNPDYYLDGGQGLVLSADQLAQDVGEWRQTRDQATNTIELTSPTAFDTGATTTRTSYPDLVATYGPNTRSVPAWWAERDDARAWGQELLIARDQVQVVGFGFQQLLIAWELLNDDQLGSWADQLWPRHGVAPLGRAFAVTDIPSHWKLADGPVVVGRVMGVTLTLQQGVVRVALATRAVPPSAVDGITIDEVGDLSPEPTYDNVDPAMTIDQLAIVGP